METRDNLPAVTGIDETSAAGPTAAPGTGAARDAAPEWIGPYHLIQIIGEGGMGQVWLAEQTSPVRRQVALKLIRAGWFDAEVIHRFESERQALAVMDHPAIAKVFDAGSTADGRPYFVMEYVQGMPITAYCDRHAMTNRERLALFIRVCEGVQHAHQKSIIHRDLKPSNILVSDADGTPVPRIIDFGIAKATTHVGENAQTVFTRLGAIIGTPEYMSPEQSGAGAAGVDTRTDVYSLGVVLYEMLSGCLPFAAAPGQPASLETRLRQLREEDPPTPSTRLKKATATLTTSAEQRGTTPKQLVGQLRGDLDWITMKALEKNPDRRYATPSELAADVRRYLADEPVVARPPSRWYQLEKFARRNRILVAGAAAVVLVLAAGATVSTILAIRATSAQQLAEQRRVQTEQARAIAVEREQEAVASRQLAVQREQEAEAARTAEARQRAAAEQSAREARQQTLAAQKNFQMARDAVDQYFTKVSESSELKAKNLDKLRRELLLTARDFYQKFVDQRATDNYLKADLGGAMIRLGDIDVQTGDNAQAEQSLQQAEAILEPSYREHPDNAAIENNLFSVYNGLGLLYLNMSRFADAETNYKKAAALVTAWQQKHTLDGPALNNLADFYDSFGTLLTRSSKLSQAAEKYETALALRRDLVKQAPDNSDYKTGLVMSDVNMVSLLAASNQLPRALPLARESVSVGEALVAKNPGDPLMTSRLGSSYNNLGALLTLTGQLGEAEQVHRKAAALRETLAAEHPAITSYQIDLAGSYINLGELAARRHDAKTALDQLQKGESTLAGVLAKEPRQSNARYFLSYDESWQARAYDALGDRAHAEKQWESAIQYDDHNDPSLRVGKALALAWLGETSAAVTLADTLTTKDQQADALFDLAGVYALASASLVATDTQQSESDAAKSIALLQRDQTAGYFQVPEQLEQLRTAPQFASLHNRADYKALLNAPASVKPAS